MPHISGVSACGLKGTTSPPGRIATAVVFGLGIATVLTLIFTPSMLAIRVWVNTYIRWVARALAAMALGSASRTAQDFALQRAARKLKAPEIIWDDDVPDLAEATVPAPPGKPGLKAAE